MPGYAAEYKRRHDAIWPELVALLKGAGISDYSIHFDAETNALFAVLWREDGHGMERLSESPLMRRWWSYMADIMETAPDGAPITVPLETMLLLP
ncbi:MAG: rhaM [Nevskia sp.]|nr:rhaM [Nevskia sp.]